jgi:zinc protease
MIQATDRTIPPTQFEGYRLGNGLNVFLHRDTTSPLAAIMVMYHVGSKNERPGRTGFAHLFEHIMFKGSAHVSDGEHFARLQEIGANVNGTTSEDRTNYYEVLPSPYLELGLYLEADRMGHLLEALTEEKLDNQRDVVKNERRQSYDNQPYGTAQEKIRAALFPPHHPYHSPVIGSMEDLSAATLEDVRGFFRTYYVPNNACLVVSGDFPPGQAHTWIEKYFGSIPAGDPLARVQGGPLRSEVTQRLLHEENVQLPRIYLAWPSAAMNTREDALLDILTTILSVGKSSRLYRSLVYEKQIAQSVIAYQDGSEMAGMLGIEVTARPEVSLGQIEDLVRAEIESALNRGITQEELEAALNFNDVQLAYRRTTALGKANGIASYHTLTGDAQNFNRDYRRFEGMKAEEVIQAGHLLREGGVVLSIVPSGKKRLASLE